MIKSILATAALALALSISGPANADSFGGSMNSLKAFCGELAAPADGSRCMAEFTKSMMKYKKMQHKVTKK